MSDEQFSIGKDHEVAMAARSLISGLSDLCDLAETLEGRRLVRKEIGDLTLAHVRLGRLLREMSGRKVA
jgi:hypothetical protein